MGTFEICDYCKERLQALWMISVGRMTLHLYSNLSELIELRVKIDEMIKALEEIAAEKKRQFR